MAAIRAALIATALVAGICSVHGVLHGSRSDIVAAPWMVQLEYTTDSEWDFGCAGAIVSNNQILTAAHCVSAWPKMPIKIRAGATDGQTGGQVIFPASIVMHPKYDARNMNTGYDIAIINLAENLDMSETIQAIALIPEAQMTREWSVLTSGGWDLDEKDSTLTIFKMSRLPQLVCDTFAHSSYLCTSLNSGAPCENDIGSPAWLAAEGSNPAYLVGVLRAGSWCKMSDNVLYTNVNVADVRSWVNANLNTRIRA